MMYYVAPAPEGLEKSSLINYATSGFTFVPITGIRSLGSRTNMGISRNLKTSTFMG
jgi:hypothetical protein